MAFDHDHRNFNTTANNWCGAGPQWVSQPCDPHFINNNNCDQTSCPNPNNPGQMSNFAGQMSNVAGQMSNVSGQMTNVSGQMSNVSGQPSSVLPTQQGLTEDPNDIESIRRRTGAVLNCYRDQFGGGDCRQDCSVEHFHAPVFGGFTSCANGHLFNGYDNCGRPTLVCCPHCHMTDYSHVHYHTGLGTLFWMCFMGLISACLLSWVPCFCSKCKDQHHLCRHCGMLLAYTRKV